MPFLTIPPAVAGMLAVCVVAVVALSTGSSVTRSVRSRRQAKQLARALDDLESMKQLHDEERRTLDQRLTRMEQALDVITIEVERVGEGQRYVTKVLSARGVGGVDDGGRPSG